MKEVEILEEVVTVVTAEAVAVVETSTAEAAEDRVDKVAEEEGDRSVFSPQTTVDRRYKLY